MMTDPTRPPAELSEEVRRVPFWEVECEWLSEMIAYAFAENPLFRNRGIIRRLRKVIRGRKKVGTYWYNSITTTDRRWVATIANHPTVGYESEHSDPELIESMVVPRSPVVTHRYEPIPPTPHVE